MAFITDQDYRVVVGESALRTISQADPTSRGNAEAEAQEEIAGYLRPKYDVEAIFATEGEERNRLLVMYLCDIALYHLSASLPQKMGTEIRKERYEAAIAWLKDVRGGVIVPDLPVLTNEDGTPAGSILRYGSQPHQDYNW